MTVSRLIKLLQRMIEKDPKVAKFEVTTEGCDCDGGVESVSRRVDDVYLRRPQP